MDNTEERVEEEEYEEAPEKGKGPILKIAVIAVVAIVAGVGVWWLAFANSAPTASFTYSAVDLRLSVNAEGSTDPDGNIASYSWDWGDSTPITLGVRQAHEYVGPGTYRVTLSVSDSRGASGAASQSIVIVILPTADFVPRHDRMSVSFDGSRSFSPGRTITAYEWDFGDSSATAMGVRVSHTYASAARYTVRLKVTDSDGIQANATRYVSPAATTVDFVIDQVFEAACPYDTYWFNRNNTYGDYMLRNSKPCTDYYPWVLFSSSPALQVVNPSFVYALYRFNASARNHPGYNLSEPVVLPVQDRSVAPAPGSYIQLNLTFDYINDTTQDQFIGTEWQIGDKYPGDGFGYLVRGLITMDLTMSRRIFGVQAADATSAQTWWYQNTRYGRNKSNAEVAFENWLVTLGNGKYDIYNAFEWFYETDITDLNATVAPDGTTTVRVFWTGWGYDILLARQFYWGNASYVQAVSSPYGTVQPRGWLPMELCWCERSKINGRITDHLDIDQEAINGYSFVAWADWGSDGVSNTSDDQPAWVWAPTLMDYVPRVGSGSPGAQGYPNSELRWYEGLAAIHGSPGSYAYGEAYEFIAAPSRWPFNAGSSITLIMPKDEVPWYRPYVSVWNPLAKLGNYQTFMSRMTLRHLTPDGNYYLWDDRAKVMSLAGPHSWGTTGLPLTSAPWIEFAPETSG